MTESSADSPQATEAPRLLGPWRTAFQWLTTLAILFAPFATIDGNSLLRLDFSTLSLHVAGRVFPIEALWLFLLLTLVLVLLFLLLTLAFGRAWCGWACPQTTLVDLVEWCARRIGVRVRAGSLKGSLWQTAALHFLYALLAVLVAVNLCWYFVAPLDFFRQVHTGTLHWSAWTLIGFTAAAVFLDLALLRRLFCKEFCPYGRFQTTLVDRGTLILRFHPDEAPRCIRCGACVRACPTGIDIREGYQVECINCGRCLDACREVMARRGQQGIIRYTFGTEGHGVRALFNPRMLLVMLALLGTTGALAIASWQRPPISLKVARNPTLLPRTVDHNRAINFYSAYLVNHSTARQAIRFTVATSPAAVQWRGPTEPVVLPPGAHLRIDFGLESDLRQLTGQQQATVTLTGPEGVPIASASVTLIAPLDKPGPNRPQ